MLITYIIIIITASVSIPAFSNQELFARMRFNPYIIKETKQWYRFFSYGLLHANWAHLLMNMFVLYSFGEQVEYFMKLYFGLKGNLYYALLYVGAIIISVVPSFEKHKNDSWYNAVGASGAVSAVVFSSIIFWPTSKIMFLLLPIPIPATVFGILYLAYSAYMAKRGTDNIGHDAHFWGALFGVVFTIVLKPELALLFVQQLTGII
jgi:membrane associated rhomboid family serine protease